jgi:CO/xanthine dehydrogenase Mo-binding subunit
VIRAAWLNPSFTDNEIPTAKDIPDVIESLAVETPELDGPYGARGAGRHPMISVAPAICQATGVELLHMPIRAEDVWHALREKERIDNWITKSPAGRCRTRRLPRDHPVDVVG